MERHEELITEFEYIFGDSFDHEVIKTVLQACEWDASIAYQQLVNFTDISTICDKANGDTIEDSKCINKLSNVDLEIKGAFEKEDRLLSKSKVRKPQKLKKYRTSIRHLTSSSEELEEADDNINWESLNEKSQIAFDNNLSTPDHEAIPKVLSNPILTTKSFSQLHEKLKDDELIQFSNVDCSCSNNELKNIDGNFSNLIPSPLIDTKEKEALTKAKSFLHKNTIKDDFSKNIKTTNIGLLPMQKLKSFFPDIPDEELKDVLINCDYDLDWSMNMLIDCGYEISNYSLESFQNTIPYFAEDTDSAEDLCSSPSKDNQSSKSEPGYKYLNFDDNGEFTDACVKNNDKSSTGSASNFSLSENEEGDSANEDAQYLIMEINTQFASQLVNLFGPISSINLSSEFAKEDCKIVLPLELCHDIYKYFAKTLEGKFQNETNILNMYSREDEELARTLQEKENMSTTFPHKEEDIDLNETNILNIYIREDEELARTLQEKENNQTILPHKEEDISLPTSFQEIVEIQKHKNKENFQALNKATFASMLSLKKLKEEYSHIHPSTVEEEYHNLKCDYRTTKTILNYKHGTTKSVPKTILAPLTTLVHKERNSSEENEKEGMEDFAIADKNPQVYRNEAQLHYLERKKYYDKAKEANQKGMKSVASFYAHIGSIHNRKLKEANEVASKTILDNVNSVKGPNTLDLHFLHVNEALREVQKYLPERQKVLNNTNLREMKVSIISGKGNHSIKEKARLKPAIKRFLQKEGYTFSDKGGMFEVTLKSHKQNYSLSY